MKLKTITPIALSAIALLSATAAYAAPFKIAVSNSYIGNEWRVEMINFMQAYAAKLGADRVTLSVDNSGTDAPKQIQAISDMIASGANAIMINPASDTALDSIIEEACKQNIVVVSFDQASPPPAPTTSASTT